MKMKFAEAQSSEPQTSRFRAAKHHTYATQLVNAGCRITSLQKLLGHERLNSMMIYAKVYDSTVEEDYYKAMTVVEQRLSLSTAEPQNDAYTSYNSENFKKYILSLSKQLESADFDYNFCLRLVHELREMILAVSES